MSVRRRRDATRCNWYRYLWVDMRSNERFFARQRRWFLGQLHSAGSQEASHRRMMASSGRLLASTIRGANQCRRMLGL